MTRRSSPETKVLILEREGQWAIVLQHPGQPWQPFAVIERRDAAEKIAAGIARHYQRRPVEVRA